jgi:hypothetical protein
MNVEKTCGTSSGISNAAEVKIRYIRKVPTSTTWNPSTFIRSTLVYRICEAMIMWCKVLMISMQAFLDLTVWNKKRGLEES